MSKKKNKKAAKNSVSKKKKGKSKSSKKEAKKVKVVKKAAPKKVKPKAIKKVISKKKIVVKKKSIKPVPKKVQAKKVIPVKKITKPVIKVKTVTIKKQPIEKSSKVAVRKAEPGKNLKPIFQPAKRTNSINLKSHSEIPDPPGKFELEYIMHTSTPILFEFLTTPPGLSEWFCDDVDIRDGIYSFKWDEVAQNARLIKLVEESVVRYQWIDKKDNSYFEFRIERDDLTNDISLIVADFADTHEDKTSSTLLWNSQIEKLLHVLGSF
jgi:uncharacterized protein YndB with AHSA1/START domain